MGGIYGIFNLINNKVYIGSVGNRDFLPRWNEHKSELRRNIHKNDYLQKSWNKYGENNFEFRIIETCNEDVLLNREESWMNYYDSLNRDKGYNLSPAFRSKMTQETRDKISKANKGKKRPEGFGDNVRQRMLGKKINLGHKHSKETIDNFKKDRKGKKKPDGFGDNVRQRMLGNRKYLSFKGHKHSKETIEKLSLLNKGKKKPDGFGDKVRQGMLDKKNKILQQKISNK